MATFEEHAQAARQLLAKGAEKRGVVSETWAALAQVEAILALAAAIAGRVDAAPQPGDPGQHWPPPGAMRSTEQP